LELAEDPHFSDVSITESDRWNLETMPHLVAMDVRPFGRTL
jgi:hypothetical protein